MSGGDQRKAKGKPNVRYFIIATVGLNKEMGKQQFGAIVGALTTNQLPPMLRDMAILVLRELRGLALDDDINPGGGNNPP
ncbi:hypothetical protein Pint_19665 [Pistacia integerrima]|uniref:Uncharacterized protein n=1 Tax=Pistacia integerrima TaxID=434235 RepID=A0ACC0XED7_9ROSI|nr:hypothetical protein Pint_19665 [Pistacia integerrima]